MEYRLNLPATDEQLKKFKVGDYVLLTGTLYTARDAAHKRMDETLNAGGSLPFEIKNQAVYYMGPSPARENRPIGSAGPTTSTRMDRYAPRLIDLGLKIMIGKGKRSDEVLSAIRRSGGIYFAAVGGAGALLSKRIISSEVIAYEDLGAEAVRKLHVEDFPVIVAADSEGNCIYQ